MNKIKLLPTVALSLALFAQSCNPVSAQEAGQAVSQEQEVEIICQTGAYGQTTCYARGSQKQEAVQVIRTEGEVVYVKRQGKVIAVRRHQVADTAISNQTYAMLAGVMVLGGLATVSKIKKAK